MFFLSFLLFHISHFILLSCFNIIELNCFAKRVVDEYQPIESNQESLRENSITTSLAPPPSRTPSPGQETELETMSDEPFVQYYER